MSLALNNWAQIPEGSWYTILTREITFVTSCLISFTENTYENGSTLKEKNLLQRRVDYFFRKETIQFWPELSPLKTVYISFKDFLCPSYSKNGVLSICLHFKDVSLYASEMDEI